RVARGGCHLPFCHTIVEKLSDTPEALIEQNLADLADRRFVARRRTDLCDAGSHQPASQHTHRFDLHLCSISPLKLLNRLRNIVAGLSRTERSTDFFCPLTCDHRAPDSRFDRSGFLREAEIL